MEEVVEPGAVALSVPDTMCYRDKTVTAPLQIAEGAGVRGVLAIVSYPADVLTCETVKNVGQDADMVLLYRIDDDIGRATVAIVPSSPVGSIAGDDVLAGLVFSVVPESKDADVPVSVTGAYCKDEFTTLELPVRDASFRTYTPMKGDLNQDGTVDDADIALMGQILLGARDPEQYLEVGDLNGDGAIDISDFTKLVLHVRGEVQTL